MEQPQTVTFTNAGQPKIFAVVPVDRDGEKEYPQGVIFQIASAAQTFVVRAVIE